MTEKKSAATARKTIRPRVKDLKKSQKAAIEKATDKFFSDCPVLHLATLTDISVQHIRMIKSRRIVPAAIADIFCELPSVKEKGWTREKLRPDVSVEDWGRI